MPLPMKQKGMPQELAEPPEDLLEELAEPPKDLVEDRGASNPDVVPTPTSTSAWGVTASKVTIEESIKDPPKMQRSQTAIRLSEQEFDEATMERFNGKSKIEAGDIMKAIGDLERTRSDKDVAVAENRKLRKLVLVLVFAVIFLCAGAFASSFAAIQISKESGIAEGGVMVDLNGNNDKAIVQVASATESKLMLFHVLVLDQAHLRTIDEIVYTYYPDGFFGDKANTVSEKVVKVVRSVGQDPLDVNVTISMQGQTRVVIEPKALVPVMLLTDGESYPICGQMKCANFKIDDPDIDMKLLDQKVNDILGPTAPKVDSLTLSTSTAQDHERRLLFNYGCCSMKASFLLGGEDTANCGLEGVNHALHNDKGPSIACAGHDKCLTECDAAKDKCRTECHATTDKFSDANRQCLAECVAAACTCWGDCDWQLYLDVKEQSCGFCDFICDGVKWAIKKIMKKQPNKC